MNWLIEPWQHAFMRQALLAGLLVAITCSLLGVHVVLRRMAYLGDAIAHTTLPGIVLAYLNQWNLFAGAVIAAIITAIGVGWLSRAERIREDTAIGVFHSGMFALGIVLISRSKSFRDFSHILFGNILAITPSQLGGIAAVGALVVVTLALIHKELVLTSVDPLHGKTIGLSTESVRYLLLILLALAIVSGIQAVGVILTTALLVTPAATASLLARSLPGMLALSVGFATSSVVAGLYASFYFDVSSGGAIVVICATAFGLVYASRYVTSIAARHA